MILITGGLGYLGGRLTKYFLDSGKQVRVASRRAVKEFEKLNGCEYVVIDILDNDSLEDACHGVKSIIHLAAMNAKESEDNPEKALEVNGLGTLKLIQSAIKKNVEFFLYFSTVHIYGSSLKGEVSELTIPRPLHSYSITHRVAEDYVLQANNSGLINGTVFRISNAIGPPLFKNVNCWNLVTNDLCKQAVVHNRMLVNSNKFIQRDYVSISVICKITHQFIVRKNIYKAEENIFNISSGVSMSLNDLTQLISDTVFELFNKSPVVKFLGNDSDINPELIISNSKLNAGKYLEYANVHHEIKELLLSCDRWFVCNK